MLGRTMDFLTNPRYRLGHGVVIAVALLLHLVTHYATYIPPLRSTFGGLPYFRLHALHEAEFLLVIAYAGVVFGVKGGLVAIVITGITSIPFILTPYVFGREPSANEIRDLTIQVGVVMLLGYLIVMLFNLESRRREALGVAHSLQEADQTKNNFLSVVAHELRNPLTAIRGYSELLLNRESSEQDRQEWATRIHATSSRLNALVEELLDVSRIEANRLEVKEAPVHLGPLVSQVLSYVSFSTDRHELRNAVPSNLPPVKGDPDKLTQVLVNLVTNAVKYSPNGGEISITARYNQRNDQVTIDVMDQGLGIPEEEQAHLFKSFHRVRTPQTAEITGTGLGLYIVKMLVERMGGSISVASKPGQGSTFSVTLPAWRQPEAQLVAEAATT